MKITHSESGKPFQLFPDTEIKIQRYNPFLSEYGEQSTPVSLPDSQYNRSILGHPENIASKRKCGILFDATIQDGEYFQSCRQAVLDITPDDEISTSFYLNDGSFYTRLEEVYITEIFADETVSGINSVADAIGYCKNLLINGGNNMFGIFPVRLPDDEGTNYRIINRFSTRNNQVTFWNEEERTETIGGKTICVPIGFYISPFLRAEYVLKRLFLHFGYTLTDNFLTLVEPFRSMVFINKVADAIVNGVIRVDQLLPKVTCKTVLELFRKKFCCEFVPDEVSKTVSVLFFNNSLNEKTSYDLSENLVGKMKVSFPENYKSIRLKSEDDSNTDVETFDTIDQIRSKYPTAYFDVKTGQFVHDGYKSSGTRTGMVSVREIVADNNQPYAQGNLDFQEISIPESIPITQYITRAATYPYLLYIGEGIFVNSSLSVNDVGTDSTTSEEEDYPLMLSFVYKTSDGITAGSVTGYCAETYDDRGSYTLVKKSDYSLVYNGPGGIFETFYRQMDNLYRNSFHTVKANLLLTQHEKLTIPAHKKISIGGAEFMINSLNFILGKNEPVESELYTLKMYEPATYAKTVDELFPEISTGYKWVVKSTSTSITEDEYNKSPYKDVELVAIYPDFPYQKFSGQKMYLQKTAVSVLNGGYALQEIWFEVTPV